LSVMRLSETHFTQKGGVQRGVGDIFRPKLSATYGWDAAKEGKGEKRMTENWFKIVLLGELV